MCVHDDMDQVDEIGLCTDIADDFCKRRGNFSGKTQEKADEADRKDKGDRGVPEIKMIVFKAFAEKNTLQDKAQDIDADHARRE